MVIRFDVTLDPRLLDQASISVYKFKLGREIRSFCSVVDAFR